MSERVDEWDIGSVTIVDAVIVRHASQLVSLSRRAHWMSVAAAAAGTARVHDDRRHHIMKQIIIILTHGQQYAYSPEVYTGVALQVRMLVACQSNTNCFFRVPLLYLIISPSPYSYSSIDLLSRDWKNYFIQSDPCWLCLTLYTISATNCEHRKFAPPPGGSPPGKYIPGDFPLAGDPVPSAQFETKGYTNMVTAARQHNGD